MEYLLLSNIPELDGDLEHEYMFMNTILIGTATPMAIMMTTKRCPLHSKRCTFRHPLFDSLLTPASTSALFPISSALFVW